MNRITAKGRPDFNICWYVLSQNPWYKGENSGKYTQNVKWL